MAVIKDLIQKEANGAISFGDYSLNEKAKKDNFDVNGDLYKIKTYKDITKLEKNGLFVYESVPGTVVTSLMQSESAVEFAVEGASDAQLTIGLEEECDYTVYVNDEFIGVMKTNLGGKLSLSVSFANDEAVKIKIKKN